MKQEYRSLAVLITVCLIAPCFGAEKAITPDLRKIVTEDGWGILNHQANRAERPCLTVDLLRARSRAKLCSLWTMSQEGSLPT